jgi:iron complex transport system ATP-binding protein
LLQADNVVLEYGSALLKGRPAEEAPSSVWSKDRATEGAGRSSGLAVPGLHGVSLDIRRGALFGILGPNGSGKTTLLRVLAGILPPASGRVLLEDHDLRGLSRRAVARRMAVVPQETHLAFDYTVLEIALMGRYPHLGNFGLEGPRDVQIARDALAATGTAHLEARSFSTLSGGEKQRVVIASALAQAAEIMLLDEPTASLDLGYQMEIGALLRDLNAQRGVTTVIATHDLNFAAGVCGELALLRDGKLMAAGPAEAVLTREAIGALYGVEADVTRHPVTGRLVVVPIRKAS